MTLQELFTTQLPLNRKERYYTGTILPQIIASDNFSSFNRFWKLIGGEHDLEIQVANGGVNIQFFTEYNLKESSTNNKNADAFGKVEGDTPDILILIITPHRKILIAIEAKMYEPADANALKIQMMKQKKILDVMCNHLAIDTENLFHVALVPSEYKRAATSEVKSIISWEEIIAAYADQSNYFLEVLKYATDNYSTYVSSRNQSAKYEAEMSGSEIYETYKNGAREFKWIGRGKIQNCKKQLAEDIDNNDWEYRKYKISTSETRPSANWGLIEDFIKLIDKKR